MDVFTLAASITLDTSEYDKSLNDASGKTHGFGEKLKSGLKTAAKVGAAAMGAATAAVGAFAKSSIDAGAQFDSSMSQVAATMGTTVDEIEQLRDFAMEMGAKTAFSATQAADALNYMALAGYDADESMQALPNVLNLAAAGGIELAYASDMVTDAQSALGLSMEESAELVDKMAQTASKSNTSVAQLGEAILTVGGTAKNLAGGTTELSTALGILADNGVKGAEGGTALRNIIMSLTAPTDTAAKRMKALGLEVFDAEGNMKPLNETFSDLNESLSKMTQEQQMQALSEMFNTRDIKSVNALLANTGDRFDELSGYIDNASGAAGKMAATQLDNLNGDITLFKSALEGAQIVISDQLTPDLRSFVQFGSNAISTLSTAFQEGGLEGAMGALGTILSDGLAMVVKEVPAMVDAGMKLLGALGQGILDNLPTILTAAVDVVSSLVSGVVSALPSVLNAGGELLEMMVNGIVEGIPSMIDRLPEVIDGFLNFITENLPSILEKGGELLEKFAFGIIEAIPQLVSKLPQIISSFVKFIAENGPKIIGAGAELLGKLVMGILGAIPEIAAQLPAVITAIVDTIKAGFGLLKDAGKYLLEGLWSGIKDKVEWLKGKVTGVVDTIKGWFTGKNGFDEHSPSKWSNQVFRYVMEGGGKGLEAGLPDLMTDVSGVVNKVKNGMDFGTSKMNLDSFEIGKYNETSSGKVLPRYSQSDAKDASLYFDLTVELDGAILAKKLFSYNKRESSIRGESLVRTGV